MTARQDSSGRTRGLAEAQHDVFLCHNSEDKQAVREICRELRNRGLQPWLDEEQLRPGLPWQRALEAEIQSIGAAAVFVGKSGLGPWQNLELEAFLREFTKRECPVIPVLLAECGDVPKLPPFLGGMTWVDFRESYPEPMAQLIWGITGERPIEQRDEIDCPTYADEATRDLGEALAAAQLHHEELTMSGQDASAALAEILDLRRQIREGGRLKPGDFLADGRFRLLEQIGKGGFSTVFKAYDRQERCLVAVKVLHGQYGDDRTRVERFFRGARKMAQLQHQGIVRVTEARIEDGGYLFFVMEYVAGGDLRQAVLNNRMSGESGLELIQGVAAALTFAHTCGVIHRDVKPANILLSEEGRPKLTDFDLVRAFDTTGGTRTGSVLGTFLYMAPEALERSKDAGVASEVYSLAMTAAFVLYGQELPPVVFRDPESFVSQLDCRASIRRALIRASSWDPGERFESVHEFSQALLAPEKSVRMLASEVEKPKAPPRVRAGKAANGVEEVRARLRSADNSDQRAQVYEKVPDDLQDADACLELVDQLRECNRDGFDLYWLWWIVEEVERRWHAGDRCQDLLARFFAHIPRPEDEELLWRVETPLEERAPLWRASPAGASWIGSSKDEEGRFDWEHARRRVEIFRPYWLGSVPVTNGQYTLFDPGKAPRPWQGVSEERLATHPRVNVSWYEAVSFCRWLSTLPDFSGCGPRLPIEEEWEFACRAGSEMRFWRGNAEEDLDAVGWYDNNSDGRTHRVGSKLANDFGLLDVHGNVWEWMLSPRQEKRYQDRQGKAHPVDPTDPSADLAGGLSAVGPRVPRVMRGGSYVDPAQWCRSACRGIRDPGLEFRNLGFRVLLSSAPSGLR